MTRYEEFKEYANSIEREEYIEKVKGSGDFEYNQQVSDLFRLQNNLNSNLLRYLFGEQLGDHYAKKFAEECNRNLLKLLNAMDIDCKFFLLYELKTNRNLFAHI